MFGDYYYNIARDPLFGATPPSNAAISGAAAGPTATQAFQFRRVDLTYDKDIAEQFAVRFRLEADQGFTTAPTTGDDLGSGKMGIFVKDAYLKWKGIFAGSDLIFGIQPSAAFEASEAGWGYRSLEKTIIDLRGIVSSRDFGVAVRGKLVGDGTLGYWILIGNDNGNAPEVNKYKRYEGQVQYKLTKKLVTTVYVDYKDAADILNSYTKTSVSNIATTEAVYVGYTDEGKCSVGVEAFNQGTQNAIKDTAAKRLDKKTALGLSIFGNCTILSDLAIVARYDVFNPSTTASTKDLLNVTASTAAGDLARNYIIVGLDYRATKDVSIIPNALYETYEAPTNGKAPDASLSARLTLFYSF